MLNLIDLNYNFPRAFGIFWWNAKIIHHVSSLWNNKCKTANTGLTPYGIFASVMEVLDVLCLAFGAGNMPVALLKLFLFAENNYPQL